MNHIDFEFLVKSARAAVATIAYLANDTGELE